MDLGRNRRLAGNCSKSAFALLEDQPDILDLKIASAALEEMREAFKMFAPFRDIPKVTIFGSARTQMADPMYMQARDVATKLADAGWMVVTGAGPGIMQAGMEGAGRDRSIGVSIRLPFEQGANPVIAGDVKYVSMKYFFTRKLMLIKESKGFVCLPGGFGTLDETFELLTLTQTGKGLPGADRPARHAGRSVLGDGPRFRRAPTRRARARRGGRHRALPGHRRRPDRRRRGARLLPELRLDPVHRSSRGHANEARPDRRSSWPLLNERFGPLLDRRDRAGRRRSSRSARRTTGSTWPASRTPSPTTRSGIQRELIDTVNSFVDA